MADAKVTDMTEATTVDVTTDLLYAVVGGNSRKMKPQTLKQNFVDNDSTAVTGTTPEVITFAKTLNNANVTIIIDYRDSSGLAVDFNYDTQITAVTSAGFTFTPSETGTIHWAAILNI